MKESRLYSVVLSESIALSRWPQREYFAITQNYCVTNRVESFPIDLKQLGLDADKCCTVDLS